MSQEIVVEVADSNSEIVVEVADSNSNSAGSPSLSPAIGTLEPTSMPSLPIVTSSTERCFSVEMYDSIDGDIAAIKNSIRSDQERSHFLGGIVRLAAHDFMDYDNSNSSDPMGPDGCFDPNHPSNAGLPADVWCGNCSLKLLHDERYSHVSRADFWIAAANAVIRQTSINNSLDMRDTFVWGRKDTNVCAGSGDRLPTPSGCDQVERVLLGRMGLTWADAVALLGAHTLGRGASKVRAVVIRREHQEGCAEPLSLLAQSFIIMSVLWS